MSILQGPGGAPTVSETRSGSGFGAFVYLWAGIETYFMTAYRTCQG